MNIFSEQIFEPVALDCVLSYFIVQVSNSVLDYFIFIAFKR